MPDFPEIGCHAIAQYPSSFELRAPVVVQRYVDGTEQRFLDRLPATRTWRIQLQRLSEADATLVRDFFRAVAGSGTSFRFQDPWTAEWIEPCWFRTDELSLDHIADDLFTGELDIYCEDR